MVWLSSDFNRMAENAFLTYDPHQAPLATLLYGPAGVGKTELLRSLYQRLKDNVPVLYLDALDFSKSYALASQEGNLSSWRRRMRTQKVLIIDQLETLQGKTRSVEELYHTYEALAQQEGRLVGAFRGEPSHLNALGIKLASRLRGGLAVPVFPPNKDERLKYLRLLSFKKFLIIEEAVLERMSEEAINFLEAKDLMTAFIQFAIERERALDEEAYILFQELKDRQKEKQLSPPNIICKAAELQGVALEDIYGVSRTEKVRQARQLAIYGIRNLCRLSYPEIGHLLNKSHSSIIKSYQQFLEALDINPELKQSTKELLEYFQG